MTTCLYFDDNLNSDMLLQWPSVSLYDVCTAHNTGKFSCVNCHFGAKVISSSVMSTPVIPLALTNCL